MEKLIRKIAILTVAAIMTMAMSATSFADATFTNGVYTGNDTTINIEKTLKVSNAGLSKVAGPGLQLSYSVAPATVPDGTVVTDDARTVHAGPADGLKLAENGAPNFAKTELLNASPSGAENKKNIVLKADLSKFDAPGIFRYELTDTTDDEFSFRNSAVERNENFNNVRFIDVYVVRNDNDQLEIGGYVVGSDADGDGNLVKETFDTSTPTVENPDYDPDDPDSPQFIPGEPVQTPDVFNTYNLTIEKIVSGSMGDRNHQFQFDIERPDNGRALYAAKGTAPTGTSLGLTSNTISDTLAHGEKYYIGGLTRLDSITVTETNNSTDTYNVQDGLHPDGPVAPNGTFVSDLTDMSQDTTVTFTNTLDSVSPTGVIMRFGAPLMILIAGIALVFMNRKAKVDTSK